MAITVSTQRPPGDFGTMSGPRGGNELRQLGAAVPQFATRRFGDLDFNGVGISGRLSDLPPSAEHPRGLKQATVFGFLADPLQFAAHGGMRNFSGSNIETPLGRAERDLIKDGYVVRKDTTAYSDVVGARPLAGK